MVAEDVKKAMEHLNGFELAGKNIEVGHVIEQHANNSLKQDDGRARFDLGATGRLALMVKLAEGTGMKVPESASNVLYGVQKASAPKVNVAGGASQHATHRDPVLNMFESDQRAGAQLGPGDQR